MGVHFLNIVTYLNSSPEPLSSLTEPFPLLRSASGFIV